MNEWDGAHIVDCRLAKTAQLGPTATKLQSCRAAELQSYRKGPCVMPPSVDLSSISICIRCIHIHVYWICVHTEFSATTTKRKNEKKRERQRGRWTGTVIDFMRWNTIWLQNARRPAETTNNFKFRFRFIGIFRSVDFIYVWFGERNAEEFYAWGFSHSAAVDRCGGWGCCKRMMWEKAIAGALCEWWYLLDR